MQRIEAGTSVGDPPEWAILERNLLSLLSDSIEVVEDVYVHDNGRLRWPAAGGGLDDAYEGFSNWPLVYLLGGDKSVLEASIERWEAITEQFSPSESDKIQIDAVDEFPSSLDWMHQGEGHQFFYRICLAAPDDERFRNRSTRFADLYLPGGDVENYDAAKRQIVAPETGSEGPSLPVDGPWTYQEWKDPYHLPFTDVEGIKRLKDLKDPEKATRMGAILKKRWRGEVAANLGATSLVTTAYLLSGDDRYREWVLEYVDAWQERTERNDGIVPDNIGPSGEIGEYINGDWFGGYYGWTWPHGWPYIADPMIAAGENATLLEGGCDHFEMSRSTMDALDDQAIERDGTCYVPYKHGYDGTFDYEPHPNMDVLRDENGHVLWRDGWFEFQPMADRFPVHLWHASQQDQDKGRLKTLSKTSRNPDAPIDNGKKDAAANEGAWAAFLLGERPEYPTEILRHCHRHAHEHLEWACRTPDDYTPQTDEFLNRRNPVDVEGLVHCTLGGPMPLYNAGLLHTRVRHFDPERARPGLPPDVAALVTEIRPEFTSLELVNVGGRQRTVTVQAGTYGEHDFGTVTYTTSETKDEQIRVVDVDDAALEVSLAGASQTKLELETRRHVNDPSCDAPWDRPD